MRRKKDKKEDFNNNMMGLQREESARIHTKYTKLLDWKLDFLNPVYTEVYEKEYHAAEVPLARAAIAVGASSFLIILLGNFIEGSEHFDVHPYIPLLAYSCWYLFWLPLYYFNIVKKYCGTITCFVLGAVPLIVNVGYIIDPTMYSYDTIILNLSLFSLLAPLVLRLHVKYIITLSLIDLIIFVTTVLIFEAHTPTGNRIAIVLPTLFNFILGTYCGYFSEKRWKFDFFRRQLLAAEATKLQWVVARDASLLRNIFPKNLSDELERRMVDQQPEPSHFEPTVSFMRVVSNKAMKLQQQLTRPQSANYELSSNLEGGGAELDDISLSMPNGDSFLSTPTNRSRAASRASGRFPALSVVIPLSTSIRGASFKPSFLSYSTSSNNSDCSSVNVSPITPKSSVLSFPPVVTTPCKTPDFSKSDIVVAPYDMMEGHVITTSGQPLHPANYQPELHTFLTGTRHDDGTPIALSHSYPNVTVIFADIVGFTSLSSSISPQELVSLLNNLFNEFDDIMDFHDLEKIRTVGDAYLCVGNMSVPLFNHEEEAVRAAKKMIAEVHKISPTLSLRVGIASGPLIAGITGTTKWNYDIFGKPLSHANLMETMAPPDCIAISQDIFDAVKNNPEFYFEQINNLDEHYAYIMKRGREPYVHSGGLPNKRLAAQDSLMYLTQPILDRVHREILDESMEEIMEYTDSRSFTTIGELATLSKITIAGHQSPLGLHMDSAFAVSDRVNTDPEDMTVDVSKKFGFNREDLEKEEKSLMSRWVVFSFLSKDFEKEFSQKTIHTIHTYTNFLILLFSLSLIVIILSDVASNATDMTVIIISVTSVVIMVLYILYSHFMDSHPVSDYVAAATALCYVVSLALIYHILPSGRHLTFIILTVISVSSFVRVPLHLMLIIQFIFCAVSMVILILNPLFRGYHAAVSVIIFLFFVVSILSQRSIQRSFRRQFLAHKTILVDMYHQRVSQRRSKLLIHNILPEEIVSRLHNMEADVGVVDLFEEATMMFVNITNLVELTEPLDASSAFQVYNEIFTLLDEVTRSYGLEKIKTINNVYMIASGLPKRIPNHADVAVQVAIEMYRAISQYSFPFVEKKFRARFGMATGPVVAGIIGKKKYAYDCWSDTTNTASRMESNGWHGYLQVTPATFELLKQKAHFEKRENLTIKGKGKMDTYVLALKKFAPRNINA